MTGKRSRRPCKPATPHLDGVLRDSMHKMGMRDAGFYGFALARLRRARNQSVCEQAAAMGVSESALAHLAMCRVPRPDQRADDLDIVARRVGVGPEVLESILGEAAALRESE